jgi:hypothetical protein
MAEKQVVLGKGTGNVAVRGGGTSPAFSISSPFSNNDSKCALIV